MPLSVIKWLIRKLFFQLAVQPCKFFVRPNLIRDSSKIFIQLLTQKTAVAQNTDYEQAKT